MLSAPSQTWLRNTTLGLILSTTGLTACAASMPEPCGPPPTLKSTPPVFRDPYTSWRRFTKTTNEFQAAIKDADQDAIQENAWIVCRNAVALRRFTLEVSPRIREPFVQRLNAVVSQTASLSSRQASPQLAEESQPASEAIAQLSSQIPRFWRSSAARLRGRGQPGSPLRTHD